MRVIALGCIINSTHKQKAYVDHTIRELFNFTPRLQIKTLDCITRSVNKQKTYMIMHQHHCERNIPNNTEKTISKNGNWSNIPVFGSCARI